MKKFLYNFILLLALGAVAYNYRDEIRTTISRLENQYFPCSTPIKYSIGSFDERFKISKEDFIKDLKKAEDVWESPTDKNLLEYSEDSELKVNLFYDSRQESTNILKSIGNTINSSKSTYESLKSKFITLKSEYDKDRAGFVKLADNFNLRNSIYKQEVNYLNSIGGANNEQYERLQQEKSYLEREAARLTSIQEKLNQRARDVNAFVGELNSLAKSLNLNVQKYNEVGSSNGEEFEEGLYISGPLGNMINVYQFENREKLVRVLAHEFGHALGIGHVENKDALMYRLNSSSNMKLTTEDLVQLNTQCTSNKIKNFPSVREVLERVSELVSEPQS